MLKMMNLTVIVGVLVSGCTTVVDTYCANYVPVAYSASRDTPETVRQVQENNAVWKKLCN
jgi:uncharacterized protein YceK